MKNLMILSVMLSVFLMTSCNNNEEAVAERSFEIVWDSLSVSLYDGHEMTITSDSSSESMEDFANIVLALAKASEEFHDSSVLSTTKTPYVYHDGEWIPAIYLDDSLLQIGGVTKTLLYNVGWGNSNYQTSQQLKNLFTSGGKAFETSWNTSLGWNNPDTSDVYTILDLIEWEIAMDDKYLYSSSSLLNPLFTDAVFFDENRNPFDLKDYSRFNSFNDLCFVQKHWVTNGWYEAFDSTLEPIHWHGAEWILARMPKFNDTIDFTKIIMHETMYDVGFPY